MELTKKNLIIVGGIILALLLGIVLLSKKPTQTGQTNPNPTGRDFNEIEEEKKVITPTPTTVIVKITPTKAVTPTLTQTPTPTNTPTPTSKPTRTPTRRPTATPIPDNSIKSTGVSLNITELHLEKDSSYQVLFRIEPNDTTDKSVNWSSNNGNVATVNNDGKITAKSSGDAVIMAKTSNNKTNFVRVFVFEKPSQSATSTPVPKISIYPTRIFLNYSTAEVKKGEYLQLRANLEPINVTDFSTKWTSSNASIAIVDIKGRVTAKKPGTAIISAKTVNGLVDTSTITVGGDQITTTPPVTNPTLQPTQKPTVIPTQRPTATPTKRPAAYTLVWNDEFNGTTLDTKKWTAVANCTDHWNEEQQCYTADAVSVSGGNLIIKSERRKLGGYNFTSGSVKSDGSTIINGKITTGSSKYTVKYGKIEFRARLPAGGQGIWPALWMIPPPYSNPPELEIVEAFSDTSTIYTNYWYNESGKMKQAPVSYKLSSSSTAFHIFAVEWEPGVLRWYTDGVLKRTLASSIVTDIPMFIIMNTALGGKGTGPVASSTSFPQYFYIDYVRVYQK